MTEKGKEYLLKVKEIILKDPKQFDMSDWIQLKYFDEDYDEEDWEDLSIVSEVCKTDLKSDDWCGTTCCIAGWIVTLAKEDGTLCEKGYSDSHKDIGIVAGELIGVEPDVLNTLREEHTLFFERHWPRDLFNKFQLALTKEDEAKVAAEAIDRFIAGGGSFNHDD